MVEISESMRDVEISQYVTFGQSRTERLRELVSGIMTEDELEEAHNIIDKIENELGEKKKKEADFGFDEYTEERVVECIQNGQLINIYESTEPLSSGIVGLPERRVELEFVIPMETNV